jgi:hypothetical protein
MMKPRLVHHDPVDLVSVVRSFINGKIKDTLPSIIRMSGENHVYLKSWKESRWEINDIRSLLGLIIRYELNNDLQLQGKGVWVLQMILEYGGRNSPSLQEMYQDEDLVHSFNETLLKIAFEYPLYEMIIQILRLSVKYYKFSAGKLFETGFFAFCCFLLCLLILSISFLSCCLLLLVFIHFPFRFFGNR